jgi:hypothetical protein
VNSAIMLENMGMSHHPGEHPNQGPEKAGIFHYGKAIGIRNLEYILCLQHCKPYDAHVALSVPHSAHQRRSRH